ncbi:MAG: polyprenyl synthetase family protein [Candidatus Latescibacterota bacterium]|jgi:geranylgeranyl diphosphate synthase type II
MSSISPALSDYLHRYIPEIEREMFSFLPVQEPGPFLYASMRDYPQRGGKRFRPALVLISCEAFGGDLRLALRTAAAFEMYQSFAVVHDDIEDDSELRRGKPCLHRLHGVPLSINIGDALYAKVFEVLVANRPLLGDGKTLALIDEMVRGSRETCEGQAYDMGWIRERCIPTEDQFMVMLRKKTGWYTGRGPCTAGAIIAGAPEPQRRAIGDFGEAMAMAFQIRDDLLNIRSSDQDAQRAPGITSGAYGKERGGDIAEGKRTLIVIDLLRRCASSEREEVLRILHEERQRNTPEQIEWVIGLIERYGSDRYAEQVCQAKARESLVYLDGIPAGPARDLLGEMLDFLVERAF